MKKRISTAIISFAVAAFSFSTSAFAAAENDPDFILNVGDTVEPYNFNGDDCGYIFEVIKVKTADEDVYYTMRLTGYDQNIIIRISDTDLWNIGFNFWRADN